jgi:peptidoglycan/LPS O-acetylase OafA/YrhL
MKNGSTHLLHPQYRSDIDGLRAVSIFSVVAFHAFPDVFRGGFVGVDVFFVISGFLISTILFENIQAGVFRLDEFYARRIARIFPALLLVLFCCYCFGWFVLLSDEYRQLGKHIAGGAGFVANFVLWGEAGYFDNAADTKPLLHLWSLGIEEQFYILWPVLVWLAMKRNVVVLSMVCVLAVSFYLNMKGVGKNAVATFYSPQTRFWELLCGAFLAWVNFRGNGFLSALNERFGVWFSRVGKQETFRAGGTVSGNLKSLTGFLLIICSVGGISSDSDFPGALALLPVIGAVLIISAGPAAWLNKKLLSNRLVVWLGLISFPLYLWHWPLLSFARIVKTDPPSASVRIVLVLASVFLAWATYEYIEKPVRYRRKTPGFSSLVLLFFMVFVGAIGFATYKTDYFHSMQKIVGAQSSSLALYDKKISANPNYGREQGDDRMRFVRSPYCYYKKRGQSFEEYEQGMGPCLAFKEGKKNVLIVGDSHAADLYFALSETHKDINFLQVTGAGCNPIRKSYKDPDAGCLKLIDYGIKFGVRNPVDAVILAGHWSGDFDDIQSEIDEIKGGGRKVILVGPPVEFKEDVNKFISRRSPEDDVTTLTRKYVNRDKLLLNFKMRDFSARNNVHYLDRTGLFCHSFESCKLLSDDGDLFIWDYGHLLRAGALYMGNIIFEEKKLESLL